MSVYLAHQNRGELQRLLKSCAVMAEQTKPARIVFRSGEGMANRELMRHRNMGNPRLTGGRGLPVHRVDTLTSWMVATPMPSLSGWFGKAILGSKRTRTYR
jgi:hypothetical protein